MIRASRTETVVMTVAFVAVLAVVGLILYLSLALQGRANEAAKTRAEAALSDGAAAAAGAASEVTHSHYATYERRVEVMRENADAIRNAPGAAAPLDPDYVRVLCDGLRRYDSGRGACDQVQPPDPEGLAAGG